MAGKHAVIIGRSNIVGKPMASLLLLEDATVTICHSRTPNLSDVCKRADILICAIGKANMIDHNFIKPNAVVIDVGMNRDSSGHICGDVHFNDVKDLPGFITPVPGGVGPMTITMLMYNLLTLTKLQKDLK
jgi:methylenetetrahydrofolate dehydrogenase (NADP+)/methenyltetrahydrofolate cyclohydrolase